MFKFFNIISESRKLFGLVSGNFTFICSSNCSNSLLECIDQIEEAVLTLLFPYQNQINLILTVPGIKDISAITIFSEIGPDMSAFKNAEHLCSWAGLTPQCNESAGKKKSVHISRAGVYIKPLLVQCANNAIRDKSCPYFKLRYDAIKKRRGHKRAIIAIARMCLHAFIKCYLKTNLLITKFMSN